jgi:hypothetical protein
MNLQHQKCYYVVPLFSLLCIHTHVFHTSLRKCSLVTAVANLVDNDQSTVQGTAHSGTVMC